MSLSLDDPMNKLGCVVFPAKGGVMVGKFFLMKSFVDLYIFFTQANLFILTKEIMKCILLERAIKADRREGDR